MTNVGQTVTIFPNRLLDAYMQRWQFSIQRQLGGTALFELAYVGNRSVHLRVSNNIDTLPVKYLSTSPTRDNTNYNALTTNVTNPFYPLLPGTSLSGSTIAVSQLLVPYPQFTGVTVTNNSGYAFYNALQGSFRKRFSRGLTAIANYTWSKSMQATTYMNPTDPAPSYSISDQDRPHRLVVTGIYELPFGFQVQGIYQWQMGGPLGFGNDICYCSLNQIPASERTLNKWFNTSVFETSSSKQLVDNIRTFPLYLAGVRAPNLSMLDLGISKEFKLRENLRFQIRGEAFNAMNHPVFQAPSTSVTSSAFGTITATGQLPRTVELLARLRW